MAGSFAGFVSRAQWGARAPRNVSRKVTPKVGGMAVHYNGPKVGITARSPHSRCVAAMRSMQNYHMDRNGWADWAYNFGACQHGYVFAGRGYGVRSAAQGTNNGNQNYLAVHGILGEGDTPSADMIAAIEWVIVGARGNGGGRGVRPHSDLYATACPGVPLRAYTRRWNGSTVIVGGTGGAGGVGGGSVGPGKIDIPAGYVLAVDGILGPITWATWVHAMASPVSTGQLWARTQEHLVALGQMGAAHISGAPNPGTTRALQKMAKFPQTGVWDNDTKVDGVAALQKMMPTVAYPPPGPRPAPAWPFPTTHRIGANPKGYATWHDGSGTDKTGHIAIKQWQKQMEARWWDVGSTGADGFYGPSTEWVVNGFKAKKGISEVGLGPVTWAASWETAWT